jgi:hypothetical protein
MCLLITQTKQSPKLSSEWLKDFYSYNSDGVGVMRAENNELIVEKILPVSADEFVDFYNSHIYGYDCAFHLRMKTHGNIDLENCHPYEVLKKSEHGIDLWLMHNGILHTDNKADISKSDTWHYIRDYLRPMLENNPSFAFTPAFNDVISDHIGNSNKFVLLDNLGRMTVLNADAGVYWAGLWLSNTYAWTASNSASKTYLNDSHIDQEQALEQIPVKPVTNYPVWDYGYGSSSYQSSYSHSYPKYQSPATNDLKDAEYDIESLLYEFQSLGLTKAEKLPMSLALDFVDEFSLDDFYDIAYMVMDNQLDQDTFLRVIANKNYAKEVFSWLQQSVYAG